MRMIWTPPTFGQARMASLGWLYRLALDGNKVDEFLAERRKSAESTSASPRELWDWVYLQAIRNVTGEMLAIAKPDPVCRRLMTAPGVGALVALTFKSAVDDPGRFTRSRALGAYFGLTPKKYQSGEKDVTGAISRVGDPMVRVTLYEAANIMLSRVTRFSSLKRWALDVAKRRGLKRAKVALARKLATVLHRMWIDGTTFHWGKQADAAV